VVFRRASGAMNLAVGFQPTVHEGHSLLVASATIEFHRQNSIVADATGKNIHASPVG